VAVALTEPAREGGRPAPLVRYEPALYEDGTGEILAVIRRIELEFGTALLVGHNPATSQLSALLDPEAARDSDGLRTSGIAVHRWEGPWSACGPGSAPLIAAHTARPD